MRDIKFRAWGKTLDDKVEKREKAIPTMSDPFGLEVVCNECGTYSGPSGHNMDGKTILMQYTGLKDKNGKEIYEGDILDTGGINYYIKSCLPFIELIDKTGWEYDNGDYYQGGDNQAHNWDEFEVIGNIYEDKELLKGGEAK